MKWFRRWGKRLLLAVPVLFGAVWLSLAPQDPRLFPARAEARPVWVVDHGWHTGIVVDRGDLKEAAQALIETDEAAARRLLWLADRFPAAEWLEIGWGDSEFYRATPGVEDVDAWLAVRALLWPTESALQIVPGWGAPDFAFAASDRIQLPLSKDGLGALARALADSIPDGPQAAPLGPSLYGGGAFFASPKSYHLFRTCNHWIAALLRRAGVPSSALPGTLSATLMAELRIRAMGYL